MFPKVRLDTLGDAIFGGATTLLVLDIRLPIFSAGFDRVLAIGDRVEVRPSAGALWRSPFIRKWSRRGAVMD